MLRSTSSAALLLLAAACSSARPTADERPVPSGAGAGSTISSTAERVLTSPPSQAQEAGISEIIPVPADQVYALLDEAYAAVGIEVRTSIPRERTLGNTSFVATRRIGRRLLTEYVRCSEDPLGGSMSGTKPVHLSVLSTVTPAGESSRLTTRVQAATSTSERAGDVPCVSTGLLEAAISVAVKRGLIGS